jgi:hypothetical protein
MNVRQFLIILSAASLAACSSGPDLPPLDHSPPVMPTMEEAIAVAHGAASAEKLVDPIEFSEARQAKSLGPGDYMLCIRGSRSPADPGRTYAAFFADGKFRDSRPSVILDECETQTYSPLPAATGATPAPAPNPAPEPVKHGKRHVS